MNTTYAYKIMHGSKYVEHAFLVLISNNNRGITAAHKVWFSGE